MFNWFDWVAVLVGTLAVGFGLYRNRLKLKLSDHFVNFCSGASSLYLFVIAWGIAKDPKLFQDVATSNSVLLAASLVFAGAVNLQVVAESVRKS